MTLPKKTEPVGSLDERTMLAYNKSEKTRKKAAGKAAKGRKGDSGATLAPWPGKPAGPIPKAKIGDSLPAPVGFQLPVVHDAMRPPSPATLVITASLAIRDLLRYIGEDPDRPGLKDTPARVLKGWREAWGAGYRQPAPVLTCFPDKTINYDEMVVVSGMRFYSHCEHHMAPFFGTCDIGYLPKKKTGVVGLSKLARVVDHFSRRLQVQERLTAQIADYLKQVSPDVAVRMKAQHFCMCSRGVMQPAADTTTTVLYGRLRDVAPRAEFLSSLK